MRCLLHAWRTGARHGPRPNARLLEDGMDIMLATSARIGEVMALRRSDVEVTAATPTVLIAATDTWSTRTGRRRKNAPKRSRQRRRVALPGFAGDAVRHRLTLTELAPDAPLFATSTDLITHVSTLRGFLDTIADEISTSDPTWSERLHAAARKLSTVFIFWATAIQAVAVGIEISRALGAR